jgi:hypothetical protein
MPTRTSVGAAAGLLRGMLSAVAMVWIVVGLVACGGGAVNRARRDLPPK